MNEHGAKTSGGRASDATDVGELLEALKEQYTTLHTAKEERFWTAYMGNADDLEQARAALAEAEIAMNRFLQDGERLARLRRVQQTRDLETAQRRQLRGWIATFAAHVLESADARALSEEIVELESALARERGAFQTGYVDPHSGERVPASSVRLRLLSRTADDARIRKAAFEGLRDVERFVLDHGFLEIVRKRNQLGRMLGYEDYYDWRVAVTEGMRKKDIFDLLDALLERTEESSERSLAALEAEHGPEVLEPWNFQFMTTGALERQVDAYFPFAASLRRWGQTFDALGVRFRGATLTLDLLERENKYENGFMHGPELAFFDDGEWRPARINFTANAIPEAVGSGKSAITTLFHEGGHAAHFSNILGDAPCFSHEFAPTSIAYAETQSMFMDSLLEDADWRRKYARTEAGEPMPVELIEAVVREQQPLMGWNVRAMMTIPFAERALYELPEDELTPENVLETFRDVERRTQGLSSGIRPVLCVPHLLSGEASAYYHGYVMAEMAVYQTRAFFLERDGHLTDNPRIGRDLAEHYWKPGNAVPFDETLRSLTGEGLGVGALADACNASADDAIANARAAMERANVLDSVDERGRDAAAQRHENPIELDATIRVVHGREVIASTEDATFEAACREFEQWIESLTGGADAAST